MRPSSDLLVELVEDLEAGRVGTDRRRGREAIEVVGTQRVDQGIGLPAVTADELLEEAVLQRLAPDGPAGAVPIVDEHQRIGTPAREPGQRRASSSLAALVCGEACVIRAIGLETDYQT